MSKWVKLVILGAVLTTLTACTGRIENKKTTVATIIYYTQLFLFQK